MRDSVSFGKLQLPPDVEFGVVDKQVGKGQCADRHGWALTRGDPKQ